LLATNLNRYYSGLHVALHSDATDDRLVVILPASFSHSALHVCTNFHCLSPCLIFRSNDCCSTQKGENPIQNRSRWKKFLSGRPR
jgi:hypothetical protein